MAAGNAQGTGMPDPIHQFEIHTLIPLNLFGYDVSFTNSVAVHAGCRAADRRPADLCHARRLAGADAACSRRPRSATSSSPTWCAIAPASRAMKFFPLDLHAVRLHLHLQHAGHDPRRLHGDEPHHRHGRAGGARVPDRADRRLRQERPAASSSCSCPPACRSTSCRW